MTAPDIRFIDDVITKVQRFRESELIGWEGSDEWIRGKFHGYFYAALSIESKESQSDFGEGWASEWIQTPAFLLWKDSIQNAKFTHPGLSPATSISLIDNITNQFTAQFQKLQIIATQAPLNIPIQNPIQLIREMNLSEWIQPSEQSQQRPQKEIETAHWLMWG